MSSHLSGKNTAAEINAFHTGALRTIDAVKESLEHVGETRAAAMVGMLIPIIAASAVSELADVGEEIEQDKVDLAKSIINKLESGGGVDPEILLKAQAQQIGHDFDQISTAELEDGPGLDIKTTDDAFVIADITPLSAMGFYSDPARSEETLTSSGMILHGIDSGQKHNEKTLTERTRDVLTLWGTEQLVTLIDAASWMLLCKKRYEMVMHVIRAPGLCECDEGDEHDR